MEYTRLGRTGLSVSRTSFGALPIQRIPESESTAILRAAYEAGINFYDTANAYTDSEFKLGQALGDVRRNIIIATKTAPAAPEVMQQHLEQSLKMLRTDYIDIYQLHCAPRVYRPGEEDGVYDWLLQKKKEGAIRHISVTAHRIGVVPTLYIPQDQAVAAARLLSGEKTKDSAYLRLVLNGCDFYIDIPAGKESSSAALEAILAALTPDAVLYWSENGGERKLTLAQAREKCGFAASSALDFSDVADSEYAQEIDSLAASRIVFGDGGKFRPDATMTRAEVCALLAQVLDLYSTANGYFTDVAKGSWYAPSVNAMAAIGLVSGVGGGKFDPNATMTQEEFITVLGRLVEFVNLDAREFLDKNPLAILQPLPKYKSFSHWAIRSAELLTNSVFDENGDAVNMYCMSLEDIEPQAPILREQAAAALYNALRTTGVLKY